MNDKPLEVKYGAPLRLRLERQLGYKMTKYIKRIQLMSDFAQLGQGKGRLLGGQRLPVVRRHLMHSPRRHG